MGWHESITASLITRDAASMQFASLFASTNTLATKASALANRIVLLEAQVDSHKAQYLEATRMLAQAQDLGSPDAQKKYADMELQLVALKEEQREMNTKLTTTNQTLNTRLRDAFELLKEKDGVIQILKDEMAALQLELVQREEQWKDANAKVKKLEAENTDLVDRWIKLKSEEASRLNEANVFVEEALKFKQAETMQKQNSREIQFDDATKAEKTIKCMPPVVAVKKAALHDGEINCIQVNRDGSLIATGGTDKKLILTDARTGATKSSLIGSLQAIMSVSFSLDGDLVMGTSNDNSVKIWSISTSRLRHTLTGHIGKVFSAKFTDSNRVISGSHDRTLKVWDLNKGCCLRTIFTLSSCNDLDIMDGEGTLIISGHLDNNLRVWDTRTGNLVREVTGIHSQQVTGVTIAPS
ncbi:UNVERIFIED_CONTAM: hypothetical protein HDU68_009518 [Siphonaria sp. JEL0065]|nr:hypothetical protein HDU68_009518 [Siphonaria sp. JEL0065]